MATFIPVWRDGVVYWARHRDYNQTSTYELCDQCRKRPTCEGCERIKGYCLQEKKRLVVWECAYFVER